MNTLNPASNPAFSAAFTTALDGMAALTHTCAHITAIGPVGAVAPVCAAPKEESQNAK